MLFNIPDNQLQPFYGADGDPATRYSSGTAGVAGMWFQLDLCRNVLLDGVHLLTAPAGSADTADAPASYDVQVSLDGTTWTKVAMSSTAPPSDAMITFTAPTLARYVRINQDGNVGSTLADGGFKTNWWSIHEFGVHCPVDGGIPDAATPEASTDSALDSPLDSPLDSAGDVLSQ
jgi:hypothetical protein